VTRAPSKHKTAGDQQDHHSITPAGAEQGGHGVCRASATSLRDIRTTPCQQAGWNEVIRPLKQRPPLPGLAAAGRGCPKGLQLQLCSKRIRGSCRQDRLPPGERQSQQPCRQGAADRDRRMLRSSSSHWPSPFGSVTVRAKEGPQQAVTGRACRSILGEGLPRFSPISKGPSVWAPVLGQSRSSSWRRMMIVRPMAPQGFPTSH